MSGFWVGVYQNVIASLVIAAAAWLAPASDPHVLQRHARRHLNVHPSAAARRSQSQG